MNSNPDLNEAELTVADLLTRTWRLLALRGLFAVLFGTARRRAQDGKSPTRTYFFISCTISSCIARTFSIIGPIRCCISAMLFCMTSGIFLTNACPAGDL